MWCESVDLRIRLKFGSVFFFFYFDIRYCLFLTWIFFINMIGSAEITLKFIDERERERESESESESERERWCVIISIITASIILSHHHDWQSCLPHQLHILCPPLISHPTLHPTSHQTSHQTSHLATSWIIFTHILLLCVCVCVCVLHFKLSTYIQLLSLISLSDTWYYTFGIFLYSFVSLPFFPSLPRPAVRGLRSQPSVFGKLSIQYALHFRLHYLRET